jgi:sugar phosphate isomerase/epimerase
MMQNHSKHPFQGHNRRDFLRLMALGAASLALPAVESLAKPSAKMRLGLVTYQWGRDWDLPTLIANCEKAKVLGVELRTQHAHGVEPSLNAQQRKEVKKRFADSPVVNLGYGANDEYHSPDPEVLRKNMENTKALLHLCHDIGATGVKVKPNAFPKGVPHEKTIEQIGKSLLELGRYAADLGQLLRLEVHGNETQELPNIKAMMDIAKHPNVKVCWNSNDEDLIGGGLEYNFNLVKDRLGDTVHVRELNVGDYPYQELMNLFVKNNYNGWVLLEARTEPADRVAAMIEQRQIFEKMIATAQKNRKQGS